MTTRPSTTTRPEMIRLQNTHARGSTSSAVTLRRRQIMLQRRIVESQRRSSTPAHVHLQPNYYRPRHRRARRQILSSLLSILNTFGPLEADETNVVEKATCNEVDPRCSTNRDELVVIENETTNSAVDVTQSETEPQANVSPSGEIQDNNQSINPEKTTNSAVDVTQGETEPQANVSPSGEIQDLMYQFGKWELR